MIKTALKVVETQELQDELNETATASTKPLTTTQLIEEHQEDLWNTQKKKLSQP